jgi:UDP-glucose 4-epimerase
MENQENLPAALVTGAAGFIGSHLIRFLAAQERVRVIALDDLSGGFRENIPAEVDFVQGSVTDQDFLKDLFAQYQFRYVYHLAAYAAEGLSHFIRRFNYTNNVIGSINLINESVRNQIECFVFTSSIAVYGAVPPPMREDQAPQPEDPYGVAKLTVELDLAAAHKMFGLRHVIFRPHNVYGEFQNLGDPYRNVVGIFMNQIMQGKPMTIFGDGSQQRAFSYVGDIIPMISQCVGVEAAQQQVFNIGADKPYSVNDLARQVAAAMDAPDHPIEHLPAREEVQIAFSDHSKAERVFGGGKHTALDEGLKNMAAWARRAGVQSSKPFTEIEVDRNMPPSWRRLLEKEN